MNRLIDALVIHGKNIMFVLFFLFYFVLFFRFCCCCLFVFLGVTVQHQLQTYRMTLSFAILCDVVNCARQNEQKCKLCHHIAVII